MSFITSLGMLGKIFVLVSFFGVIVFSILNSTAYWVSTGDAAPFMRNTVGRFFASDDHLKVSLDKLRTDNLDVEFAGYLKTSIFLDLVIIGFLTWLLYKLMQLAIGPGNWNLGIGVLTILLALFIIFLVETIYLSFINQNFVVGFQGISDLAMNGFFGEKLLFKYGVEGSLLTVGIEEEIFSNVTQQIANQTLNVTI